MKSQKPRESVDNNTGAVYPELATNRPLPMPGAILDVTDPQVFPSCPNTPTRQITILGKIYPVDFKGRDDGMVTLGTMDRAHQRIRIFDDMAYDQRCDTLLHEVLHAIDEELKLGLSEVTITRLAVGLHSAGYIRDPEAL